MRARKEEEALKKRNRIIIPAALILALTAGIYTSYAYLTAQDDVDNTFDAAEVKITVEENFDPEPPKPGQVIKKAPKVQSGSDTNCYVRMHCVFTDSGAEALCEPVKINKGWEKKTDGYYYWNGVLGPGEETGTLFDQIRIKGEITAEDIIPFDILVYAEAVQANGLSADEAWTSMN